MIRNRSTYRFLDYNESLDAVYLRNEALQALQANDETGDQHRVVQLGRCFKGDGVAARITYSTANQLGTTGAYTAVSAAGSTISFWMKGTGTQCSHIIAGSASPAGFIRYFFANSNGTISLQKSTGVNMISVANNLNNGQWHHIAIVNDRVAEYTYLFVDGVLDSSFNRTGEGIVVYSPTNVFTYFSALWCSGYLFDYRIYNTTKTLAQIQAIKNFAVDLTGLFMWNKCDVQSGTIAYDSSGNGRHQTITGLYAGFHATQDKYSFQNNVGYNISGAVFVPRNEANTTKDVLGNNLVYSGRVKYNALLSNSHCANFDGVCYLQFANSLNWATVEWQGTAALTLDSVNKRITATAGTAYDIRIKNALGDVLTHLPCAEGWGGIHYDIIGSNHATITSASTALYWGQRQNSYHYNVLNGYKLFTNGIDFIKMPSVVSLPITGYYLSAKYNAGNFIKAETKLDFTTGVLSPHAVRLLAVNANMNAYTHGLALADPLFKQTTEEYKERMFVIKKLS